MQQWRPENRPLTFDEMSMEQSKSFVKALQELKNLRPQLYSAAEYCEKSYLHNDQKQMVLENLKDYAVRALVNAVDHLGTVAYKLSDLVEQQTLDVSNAELKISCLNQRILTCQMYTDKEGLRQQQIMISSPKHHKHYILPNSVTLKADTNNLSQAEAKHRPYPPGTPAPKTLSWLLASDSTNSGTSGSPNATLGTVDMKSSKIPTEPFRLRDPKDDASSLPPRSSSGTSTLKPVGVKDTIEVPKPMSAFRSFDNPGSRALIKAPVRSKSMLSMFFAKTKAPKPKPKTVVYNYAR